MALKLSKMVTFLYILLPIWTFIKVEAATPAPAVDCSSLVLDMADCLSFVTAGSTTQKPEGSCCTGLKTVLKTDADCLCEAFRNSAQFGVTLNVTKATTLPSACHVSAPSVTNCGLGSGAGVAPGMAPALSPEALAPSAIGGSPTSSFGSSEMAPAVAPISSSSAAFSAASLALSLVAAASLSFF